MFNKRILFTEGMSNDFLLILTDAPKEEIEKYCFRHNKGMEDGGHFEMFDTLKSSGYYVKELLDSELDDKEALELLGYDEEYNFEDYYAEEDLEGVDVMKDIVEERKREIIRGVKNVMESTLDYDIRRYDVDENSSLSDICSVIGNNIDHLKRLVSELEAELNALEMLEEESD